jgi:hypothetical protein
MFNALGSGFGNTVCFFLLFSVHKDDFQLHLLSFWHVLRLYWASHFQSGYTSKERLFVQEVISVVDEYPLIKMSS